MAGLLKSRDAAPDLDREEGRFYAPTRSGTYRAFATVSNGTSRTRQARTTASVYTAKTATATAAVMMPAPTPGQASFPSTTATSAPISPDATSRTANDRWARA